MGNAQSFTGPVLVLPYVYRWEETAEGKPPVVRSETRNAFFLPERLHVRGTLASDIRSRGIFSVPVYKLGLEVEGEFGRPELAELNIRTSDVDWSRAQLAVGISDARAIQEAVALRWNEQQISFLPGTGGFTDGGTGIHAPVGMNGSTDHISFSFPLSLNGSLRADVVPFGRNTVVELQGNTGHPSFQGNWLPTDRTISPDAFRANCRSPSSDGAIRKRGPARR